MAIRMRRGLESELDISQAVPGEWLVSTDTRYIRMCFAPGIVLRMATYESFEEDMEEIQKILDECQTIEEAVSKIYEEIKDVAVDVERIESAAESAFQSEQNALNSANSASQSANTAVNKANEASESANIASEKAEQATEGANTATQKASEAAESAGNVRNMSEVSQSYAVGGTGTREGEDTDNSKYYNQQASDNADRAEEAAERASAVADVGVATTEKAGLVKPDGETIRVDLDGTIHADRGTTSYTDLENKPTINDVELDGNKTIDDFGGLTAESTVSFTEAEERTNIEVTDNVKGIFGKVKKWFADLKPHAFSNPTNNLLATVAGTPLDAVQGKVLYDRQNSLNVARKSGSQYNTLVELVEATATDISVPHYFRFKDLGGFVLGKANSWYRMLVYYQNNYNDSVTYSVGGTGILWDADNVYRVFIGGTKATGVSLTLEKLVYETELNNRINNYAFSNYRLSAETNYGMEIIMGLLESNGITDEIKKLGITLDDTLEVALSKIFINQRSAYIRLSLNSNTSVFNKSLPNSGAGILEIHKINASRGYIRLFTISNGEEFTNNYVNNALGTWQKINKTNV